jgi:diguanylate cyclase (GGDEF)-like protein
MSALSWMQPRDRAVAGRTVAWLCGVAVAVSVAFAPFAANGRPADPVTLALCLGVLAVVLTGCLLARSWTENETLAWAVCPILAVLAVVVVDLATADASVCAQIFLLFPALYGAACLDRHGAIVMTAAAVLGEVVVVGAQLPFAEAATDVGYVVATLVSVTVLLVRGGERQAALVVRLEEQAGLDALTGLVTRRVLDDAAALALSCAASSAGTSLVLIDVDRFKAVNDHLGHPCGDEVLVQLAAILRRRSRPGDVVCRMGGDEIALLLPSCPLEVARSRAEAILGDVRAHAFSVGSAGTVRVTTSLGLAQAPLHATELRGLYAAADGALYEAKRAGRDRLVVAACAPASAEEPAA